MAMWQNDSQLQHILSFKKKRKKEIFLEILIANIQISSNFDYLATWINSWQLGSFAGDSINGAGETEGGWES